MAGSKRSGKGSPRRSRSDNSSRAGGSSDGVESTSSSRRFVIKPLSTVGDEGKPTKSVLHDLERVINFIQDERHLVAYDLYANCKERIKKLREQQRKHDEVEAAQNGRGRDRTKRSWLPSKFKASSETVFDEEEFTNAVDFVRKHKDEFTVLDKRAPLFQSCRDNMDESEGWTLAQTIFGVTTYYRREKDGSLSIKLEGELKGIPLFEQVAVLREIDLHSYWAPFVTSSLTLAHFDKLDTVGWFMLGLPNFGLARDSCFRAIGCDCVGEDQSVLIVGRGVKDRQPGAPVDADARFLSDDPALESLDIPPVPTRMGSGRMTMKMFEAKIRVLGPDHCHTYILANVDPNLAFIPQSLLEFIMKKICGFLLNKLQTAAKKITKDPVRNVHAQRMRDESAFYRDWLLPKFQNVAALRGWDMPTIAAFELSEAQQVEADKLIERRTGAMHSFSHFESGISSKERADSARSEPNMYHSRELGQSDDDSDISSLSGTSQSIWKNNPIASYLREIETKTQDRKNKSVLEARRKAIARLRPKPMSVDKKERLKDLKELKRLKERKLQARHFSSSISMDSSALFPVDEHDTQTVATGITGQSVPYSPISAALYGQGRWPRLCVVSSLVLLLFILLHGERFLPTFSDLGGEMLSTLLQDTVALVYMCLCGVVHFFLCDVELIYAFEAFEMGMKTGDQVKTFYRGQVRLLVAAASGVLVVISITKAVLLAWFKASIVAIFVLYNDYIGPYFKDYFSNAVDEEVAVDDAEGTAVLDYTTVISRVPAALYNGYSIVLGFAHAVFNWQVKVFVRSNILGRSIESVTTGAYNACAGLLKGVVNSIYSLAKSDDVQVSAGYSWRDDAICTLRVLLTYTAVFLLAILVFLNILSKTYRHETPQSRIPGRPVVAAASTNSESEQTTTTRGKANGDTASQPPRRRVPSSQSVDSSARRRLKFRRKRPKSTNDDSE